MTTPTPLPRSPIAAAAIALALGLPACLTGEVPVGEDEQELIFIPESPVPASCAAFCAAAGELDCPATGDCMEICEEQVAHAPECSGLLDDVLACSPDHLVPGVCSLDVPVPTEPGEGDPCASAFVAYGTCLQEQAFAWTRSTGFACSLVGGGSFEAAGEEVHVGWSECQPQYGGLVEMEARCGAGGVCDCKVDGVVAHACQNLIHSRHLTDPGHGCCDRYFDAVVAGLPL